MFLSGCHTTAIEHGKDKDNSDDDEHSGKDNKHEHEPDKHQKHKKANSKDKPDKDNHEHHASDSDEKKETKDKEHGPRHTHSGDNHDVLALLNSDTGEPHPDREVISVLDKFLAQKKKENECRLQEAEAAWEQEEAHHEKEDKSDDEDGGEVEKHGGDGGEKDEGKEKEKPEKHAARSLMKWKVRIFVVVNRLSGKGKKANVEKILKREGGFRWKWDIFYILTGKEDVAAEVREKVLEERKYDWVFACGGDGTVSSIVSLLSGTDIPIGVVPLGTGNAFAQEMRIPLNWKHAIKMISLHQVRRTLQARPVDCMNVGSKYYMLTIDIGIGAKTVEDAAQHPEWKRRLGVWAYLISATKAMTHQEPVNFTVTIDGETVEMRATEVVLCNAGMVGMGHDIRWGPGISVDDGAIDLVFIAATSVPDYASVIRALGTGETAKNRHIKYLRANKSIEISSAEGAPVAADGDLIGNLPISIKIICGAVNVLLPQAEKTK